MNSIKGMHIIHLNVKILMPKINFLRWGLTYKVNTLSETWLNSNISDDGIMNDNIIFRKDAAVKRRSSILKFDWRTYFSNCLSFVC